MIWVLYAIMVVAIIVMIWANKQSKATGSAGFKALAVICGVVTLVTAAGALLTYYKGPDTKALIEKEMKYQRIAHKFLGKFLANKHSGAKILVIKFAVAGSENSQKIDQDKTAALEEGMAGKLKITATEEIGGGEGAMGMPMPMEARFLFTAEKFDEIVDDHPNCTLVLSLAGLPNDLQQMKFWEKDDDERPALVLVNPSIYELKKAIEADIINAVLINKPVAYDPKAEVPEDEKEAFDKRFILIYQKNVKKIAEEYPRLFKGD